MGGPAFASATQTATVSLRVKSVSAMDCAAGAVSDQVTTNTVLVTQNLNFFEFHLLIDRPEL